MYALINLKINSKFLQEKNYISRIELEVRYKKTLREFKMQSQLICQICFETYNTKHRKPTTLMLCGHSFCFECVTGFKKSTNYSCPTCREKIIDEKPNYALLEMLESLNSSPQITDSNKVKDPKDQQQHEQRSHFQPNTLCSNNLNNIYSHSQSQIPVVAYQLSPISFLQNNLQQFQDRHSYHFNFPPVHMRNVNRENFPPSFQRKSPPPLSSIDLLLGPLNLPLTNPLNELAKHTGMLVWKIEDEEKILTRLIDELKPTEALNYLPGLPAYILFMCIRYVDMLNDARRVRSLLNASIQRVKCLIEKKQQENVEHSILWLVNFFRLINNLKQYSVSI